MRITLPIAAALILTVTVGSVHRRLRAASPQDGQKPASAPPGIQIAGRVVSGDPPDALPRALVTALANGKLVASAMTDVSGRFAIDTSAVVTSAVITSVVISKHGFATTTRPTHTERARLEPLTIADPRGHRQRPSARCVPMSEQPTAMLQATLDPGLQSCKISGLSQRGRQVGG
jgi:hypothetical protein